MISAIVLYCVCVAQVHEVVEKEQGWALLQLTPGCPGLSSPNAVQEQVPNPLWWICLAASIPFFPSSRANLESTACKYYIVHSKLITTLGRIRGSSTKNTKYIGLGMIPISISISISVYPSLPLAPT